MNKREWRTLNERLKVKLLKFMELNKKIILLFSAIKPLICISHLLLDLAAKLVLG